MSGRLDGLHVLFDYDRTLVPKESLENVLAFACAGKREDINRRLAELRCRATRLAEGTASVTDKLSLLAALLSIRREHVQRYVADARLRIQPFRPLFCRLRAEGAAIHVVSAGFVEWIEPVVGDEAFGDGAILANRMRWLGPRVIGLGDCPLLRASRKYAVVRTWRQRNGGSGFAVMVGDSHADYAVHASGAAEGFVAARCYAPELPVSGPGVRRACSPDAIGAAIIDLFETHRNRS